MQERKNRKEYGEGLRVPVLPKDPTYELLEHV
jgi:hypothetical protein